MHRDMLLVLPSLLAGALASYIPEISSTLQNILRNTDKSDSYQYPTDFTRGIIPVSSILGFCEVEMLTAGRVESVSFA
jgi:hypothetical protein